MWWFQYVCLATNFLGNSSNFHQLEVHSILFRRVDINDDPGTSGCIEKTKYINQFKSELLNYKKTRHDNVELFLGACLKQPNLAIVTRNYRGWRLDNHITESPPSLDHARMIAEHVCQGIGYLHSKNIVHRDLRPANVMFDQAGKVKHRNIERFLSHTLI